MKTLFILLFALGLSVQTFALKDSINSNPEFNQLIKNIKVETDTISKIDMVKEDPTDFHKKEQDTLKVRVGNTNLKIVTGQNNAHIDVETIDDYKSKWENNNWEKDHPIETVQKHRKRNFDGHWEGFEFGGNQLFETNYAPLYPENPAFLETRPEKSFEFNWNFAEYSFGFGSYMGIVTGLGINWNDYQFKNRYTIIKDANGMIQPVELPETDFRKSKLSTVYLTAPLMFEFQIPGNHGNDRIFVAGGVIGGIKLGEHTKYKIGNQKTKDKGDLNISPLRWGYTARIGFDDVGLFATYYQVPLFQEGKGPSTTPLTIGLTFTY